MKWWSKFWRRRKQDDRVKMIVVFALAALFFSGKAIYTGIQLYHTTGECTEYILQVTSETGITDTQIKELKQMEEVNCVSRQKEISIAIMAGADEISISCVGVSKEYMKQVWNVSNHSAMKQLFVNEAATKMLTERGISFEEGEGKIMYSVTDESGVQTNETAEVYKLENLPKMETPYVFCMIDNAELADSTNTIRVETNGKDLDGQRLAQFQQMGYYVVNEAEQKEERMRQEVEVLKIRYDVITALICAIAAGCLRKA